MQTMTAEHSYGHFVQEWAELPKGKKAILFDNARAFGAYRNVFWHYQEPVRARRIHPESIMWAQNFEVIVFLGLKYETWKPYLNFRHYVLPVHTEWLK